jgi:putative NADH-flavin reductase
MDLILFGASGTIGQRILNEALARGHTVTAVARDPSRITQSSSQLKIVRGDVPRATRQSSTRSVRGKAIRRKWLLPPNRCPRR